MKFSSFSFLNLARSAPHFSVFTFQFSVNKKRPDHWSSLSWSGYQDSNLGPPAPKAGALTGLRYIPLLLNCGAKVLQFFYSANFFTTFLQKLLIFSLFVAQFLIFDALNLKY